MSRDTANPPRSLDALTARDAVAAAMHDAPVAFGLIDRELRIVYANDRLDRLVGEPAADRLVSSLTTLAPAVAEAAATAIAGGSVIDLEVAHGGRHQLISCFPMAGVDDAPLGASLVIRDVSTWAGDRERLERMQRMSVRLFAAASPQEVTEVAADAGIEVLGATAAAVVLWDGATSRLEIMASSGLSPETLERWSGLDIDTDVPIATCIRTREPTFLDDAAGATRRYPLLLDAGSTPHAAWACVPLVAHQRLLGGLALAFSDKDSVAADRRSGMLTLAAQCAEALERARLYTDIALVNQRLEVALEAGKMGWWEWDPVADRVTWSPTLERIYGLEPGTFEGTYEAFLALVHPDDRELVTRRVAEGAGGAGHEFEHRIVTPSGEVRWVDGRGRVIGHTGDESLRLGGLSMDVTDRKREDAALQFTAEASDLLAQSLDQRQILQRLAELAVPRLADWCSVTILEDGALRNVAIAHSDPAKLALVRELQERYPPNPDAPSGSPAVIRSGRSEHIREVTDEMLVAAAPDETILSLLRDLQLRSAITVPLTARGRTLGSLSLAAAESGTLYEQRDVELAEDLAHRAALAIDNARLFRERSDIADTLQASLLPPVLPDVPGFEVAARYRPGGDGVQVGGDFYDLFPTGNGRWLVVIGDVCGKGAPAATLTGVTRHTARAAAVYDDHPRHVLESVNSALLRTDTTDQLRFCTAAVCLLEVDDEQSRISVSRAGHPPPLLRRATGQLEELGMPGTLLGVYDDPELRVAAATVRRGDLIVLYTDGVTDSWRNSGGDVRLADTINTLPLDASAAAVAEQIERAAVGARGPSGDDMAILVLRAT